MTKFSYEENKTLHKVEKHNKINSSSLKIHKSYTLQQYLALLIFHTAIYL